MESASAHPDGVIGLNNVLPGPFRRARFTVLDHNSSDEVTSLPELVNFNAVNNPEHTFCVQIGDAESGETEPTRISYSQLAVAVENCANHLVSSINGVRPAVVRKDGSVQKSAPVGLLMESGATLFIYLVALLSLNVPCVLLSIRLSPIAIRHVLEQSGAHTVLASSRLGTVARSAVAHEPESSAPRLTLESTRSFKEFMKATSTGKDLGCLEACRMAVREDDCRVLILHSSGTTGLPKPLPVAHRYLLGYAGCHQFSDDLDESKNGLTLSTLPLFHGFGLLAPCLALSVGRSVCFPPSSKVPNAQLVLELINSFPVQSLMTVPSILEDMTLLASFVSDVTSLQKLELVAVGGGGIKESVGQALHSNGVRLLNHFGATELGALAPIFRPGAEYEWRYLRLRSDMGLVLSDSLDETTNEATTKLTGYPFAWGKPFELQDRLVLNPASRHPEVRLLGRKDDLIVLATGEKVLPHTMEQALEAHPLVKRAVLFGNGRFEVGLLVEPHAEDSLSIEQLVAQIWPTVLEANDVVDQHAVISSKAAVVLKPSGRAIPVSDKGVVQRKETYDTFASIIDDVYDKLEHWSDHDPATIIAEQDKDHVEAKVMLMVQSCLPKHVSTDSWSVKDDIINLGMDSLLVNKLRRSLSQSLKSSPLQAFKELELPRDFVYQHSTVERMAVALLSGTIGLTVSSPGSNSMLEMTQRFAYGKIGAPAEQKKVVLMTGTNGNLGCHLLKVLCGLQDVASILCLVRDNIGWGLSGEHLGETAKQRLQDSFQRKGMTLSPEELAKVQFIGYTVGAKQLGIESEERMYIASNVTHIFHGAWPMDFKRGLPSFEVQVSTLRELIELGRDAHNIRPKIRPKILFTSSIGAVGRYSSSIGDAVVPEEIIHDPSVSLPMGYGQAKWVCERVMQSAAEELPGDIEPMIVRIGQLAGATHSGNWNDKEHVPVLIKASKRIQKVPDLQGTLSWLPLDDAAVALAELLLGDSGRDLVCHLENPVRQSWAGVSAIIARRLGVKAKGRVPFEHWLQEALKAGDLLEGLEDFFEHEFKTMSSGRLLLDTRRSRVRSSKLRSMGGVAPDTIERYVDSIVGRP